MRPLRALYWIVWFGSSVLAFGMFATFFVAVMFSASFLTLQSHALRAALVIGVYGGMMAVSLGATVISAIWFRQRHFVRAWLAALLTYAVFALQGIVSIGDRPFFGIFVRLEEEVTVQVSRPWGITSVDDQFLFTVRANLLSRAD